jgi:hypothetical protein
MLYDEKDCEINPYIQLLNYPRCGSNFIYFIIFSITGIKIQKNHGAALSYWEKKDDIPVKDLPMIFLLRNPKECIPRQTGDYYYSAKIKDALLNLCPRGSSVHLHRYDYMLLLDHYDKFKGNKIIIYYEDLITNTKKESEKILDFISSIETPLGKIEYKIDDFEDFFNNYELNKNKSLKRYGMVTNGSITKGEDLVYHSTKIQNVDKEEIKNFIHDQYPDLFNKYLLRYFDTNNQLYINDSYINETIINDEIYEKKETELSTDTSLNCEESNKNNNKKNRFKRIKK